MACRPIILPKPVDVLFWITRGGEDLLVTLKVWGGFFDESYRERHDLFLVAGALFNPDRQGRFARQWFRLFPKGFHATEFNAPCHTKREARNRDSRLISAANLLGKQVELASIVICSANQADEAFGRDGNAQAKAYLACGACAAIAMAYFLAGYERPGRIAYVYDEGRRGEATRSLRDLFGRIGSRDDLIEIYRYASQTMQDTKDNAWLQAADYLAWEFGYYETTRRIDRLNMRTLVDCFGRKRVHKRMGFYYAHKDPESLRAFAEWVEGLRNNVPNLGNTEPLPSGIIRSERRTLTKF